MTKPEQKKAIILSAVAATLVIVFIVLICINSSAVRERNMSAESSSDLAYEATENVSVVSIKSAETSSDTPSTVSDDTSSELPASSNNDSSNASSSVVPASAGTSSGPEISDDSGDWNLRLVNGNYILPDDFRPDLATISMDYARDEGMKFDARAIDDLEAMCAAAKADGVNLMVISAYRTFSVQEGLYNNKVNYYLDQGYGLEEAGDLAATSVARPKTSEHNLGLAVDFNDVEERFENTAEYEWLRAHCTEYGFIMRYPKEKQRITGVIYEPWHYRYVGRENAVYITEKNITLEEFLGKAK